MQGILTNETRCLRCETVTARDETFLDLSLDIEQNSSITSCLKNFSSTETLNAEDKFFCDKCCRYLILSWPSYIWDYFIEYLRVSALQFTRSTEEDEDKENTSDPGYPFEAF